MECRLLPVHLAGRRPFRKHDLALSKNSTQEACFVFSGPAGVVTLSRIVACLSVDSTAQISTVVTTRWAPDIVDWVWTFGRNS
jgi:hypothetical protein